MKKSIKGNIYTSSLENTWLLFNDYLQGHRETIIVVISSKPLSARAHEALENSFARLGYKKESSTFISLQGFAETPSAPLNDKDILTLIEGLDPLFLVITDEKAANLCSAGYRRDLALNKRNRIFGREVRAFASFEAMLENSPSKQKAWGLLKTLPKFLK